MTAGSIPAEEGAGAPTPAPEEDAIPAAPAAVQPAPEAEGRPATVSAVDSAVDSAVPETAGQRGRREYREKLAARLAGTLAAHAVGGEKAQALAAPASPGERLAARLAGSIAAPAVEGEKMQAPAAPAPPAAEAPPAERPPASDGPVQPIVSLEVAAEVSTAQHQALWFTLARQRPRSVALVAVERDLPVGPLAVALAEVGRQLGDHPVTAVVAAPCDYGFVTRTTSLIAATGGLPGARPGASPLEVIVAIPPVTAEPLGLAVAQAVDAVVLCFGLGRTTIDAARETIELVGRDRIVGCVAFGEG